MIDFTPTDEQREVIDQIHRFIERVVLPLEKEHAHILAEDRRIFDERGYLVNPIREARAEIRRRSAQAGFYTIFAPEDVGGAGMGLSMAMLIYESIGKTYGPGRILMGEGKGLLTGPMFASFVSGPSEMIKGLSPSARARYIDSLVKGETTLCFALTEPDAGSDVWNMKSTAVKVDGGWRINGQKTWITNGPYADYAVTFAITDPDAARARKGGISAFFVEATSKGFAVDSIVSTMGHLGGDTALLSYNDVFVPDDNLMGELHNGFGIAMKGISLGRMSIGAKCLGFSQWALEQSSEYAKQRQVFGKPLAEQQAIQFMLAEMWMDIYALRYMTLHCAWKVDRGEPSVREISAVKALNVEACQRIFDSAIQIHGGMGLSNELQMAEGFKLARVYRIPDGTSEIQRRTIAREILKGNIGA